MSSSGYTPPLFDDQPPGIYTQLYDVPFDGSETGSFYSNGLILQFTFVPESGDFDGDGLLTSADIDDLTRQAAGGNLPAYDLNYDSFVNSGDVTLWIKDIVNSWLGDANLDGEFNSSDLVTVISSGTYEADVDAVWSTGDFNGDGRTNSSDLVTALSDGGYEAGPRPAAAVPEPNCFLLLGFGIACVSSCRRKAIATS